MTGPADLLGGARLAAVDGAYALGWLSVRRLPERAAYGLFDRIADRIWAGRGKGVSQLERNLARVVPHAPQHQVRQMSRAAMRSYFTYWCDTFRMPDWPAERLFGLRTVGEHHITDALAAGTGVVVAAPHMGNYDHGAAYLAQKYGSITTVMERLKPDSLFQRFVDFRQGLGMEVRGTGEPGVLDLMVERVAGGGIVCLLADRDLSRRGVPVTFFGERTKMPAGPALIALRAGAPLLPAYSWYEGRQAWFEVLPPVDFERGAPRERAVAQATQLLADAFAAGISRFPADWHMLQRLWLADLDPAKAAAGE